MKKCAWQQAGPAACAGGAFAFILMLTFSPLGLTAQASGDELALPPFAQTMLCAAWMVALMAALALAAGRADAPANRSARGLACICPLAGCTLACAVQLSWVPVAVALLMGTGAAAQLFLCAGACSHKPLDAVMAGSAAALALAVLASVTARAWAQAWQGTAFLGAVSLACAVTFCLLEKPVRGDEADMGTCGRSDGTVDGETSDEVSGRTAGNCPGEEAGRITNKRPGKVRPYAVSMGNGAEPRKAGCAGDSPRPVNSSSSDPAVSQPFPEPTDTLLRRLARTLAPLRYDWQPLAGGAVCALSFSFVWNQPVVDMSGPQLVGSCVGRLVGAVALAAMFVPHAGRVSHTAFTGALAVSAALGTFVWSASSSVLDSPFFMAVACASQTLFVGLLWLETLFTSRDQRHAEALPLAGMSAFLLTFIVGGAASRVLSPTVTTACVPTLLLAYLVALVLAGLHGAGARPTDDSPLRATRPSRPVTHRGS